MKTITVTATDFRNNVFEYLSAAFYGNQTTIVTKNGKTIAELSPPKKAKMDWKKYLATIQKLDFKLTEEDYQDMQKAREEFNKNRFPDW